MEIPTCNIIQKDDAASSEAFWVGGDSIEEQKLDRKRESMSPIGVAETRVLRSPENESE